MSRHLLAVSAAIALISAEQASAAPERMRYMDVALVADTLSPRPGSSMLIGLEMIPQPGWHGYWSNAGESGLPPTVRWSAPTGVEFGPLQHPAPTLLRVIGLTSFVHPGAHMLISRVTLGRAVPLGTTLPITADVNFAVCSDRLCVPQRAKLTIQLVSGDGKSSSDAPRLKQALAAEPKTIGSGLFEVANGILTLQLPAVAHLNASKTRFFPDKNGIFDAGRARTLSTAPLRIVSPTKADPSVISGVVSDGLRAFRLSFHRGRLPADPPAGLPSERQELAATSKITSAPAATRPVEEAKAGDKPGAARHGSSPETGRLTSTIPLIAAGLAFLVIAFGFVWSRRPR